MIQLSYHPGKANVVADALSRKSLHMSALMVKELELIEQFRDLSLVCESKPESVVLVIDQSCSEKGFGTCRSCGVGQAR